MTAQQIIKMGKVAVRNSATAYPIYQTLFREAFGFTPECPTCGSVNGHKHWQQFEAFVGGAEPTSLMQNNTIMSKQSFQIKNKSKIYKFSMEKNGRSIIARSYGDVMTEEFAKKYLGSAKDDAELLQQRKMEFAVLPKGYESDEAGDATGDAVVYPKKLADKKAYAAEQGYPEDEYASIRSNDDMTAYLDGKAAEATADADPAKSDAGSEEDLS